MRQMFRRMEDISRPVIMTKVWTKYHTTVSLLDLGAALIIFVFAHGAPGHVQAGLFWLSFLLSLFGLGITVAFTAKFAFEYY